MKMKLYYVVKENIKVFGHEADVVYVAGPFGTYQQATEHRLSGEEYIVDQEIEVD